MLRQRSRTRLYAAVGKYMNVVPVSMIVVEYEEPAAPMLAPLMRMSFRSTE